MAVSRLTRVSRDHAAPGNRSISQIAPVEAEGRWACPVFAFLLHRRTRAKGGRPDYLRPEERARRKRRSGRSPPASGRLGAAGRVLRRWVAAFQSPLAGRPLTARARSRDSSISADSPRRGGLRTKLTTSLWSPGWPMPPRRRQKSWVPRWAVMSLRPLWPPRPLPNLRRNWPGNVELVSAPTGSRRVGCGRNAPARPPTGRSGSAKVWRHQQPHAPLRALAARPETRPLAEGGPSSRARRSLKPKPGVVPVWAYSSPGLPRPTTSFGARAGSSVSTSIPAGDRAAGVSSAASSPPRTRSQDGGTTGSSPWVRDLHASRQVQAGDVDGGADLRSFRSTPMNSGRRPAGTRRSVRCRGGDTMPPSSLTPGAMPALMKCSGTFTWILWVASTR